MGVAKRDSFSVPALYPALHSGTKHFSLIAGNFRKPKLARNKTITAEKMCGVTAGCTLLPATAHERLASVFVARPGGRGENRVSIFARPAVLG